MILAGTEINRRSRVGVLTMKSKERGQTGQKRRNTYITKGERIKPLWKNTINTMICTNVQTYAAV